MSQCPCCSGKPFEDCCEPIINNTSAPTAAALMRSRFTAYYLGNAPYLFQTIHHSTRQQHNIGEIKKWSSENTWKRLEVMSFEHGRKSDIQGLVEFKAHYLDKEDQAQVHHERSNFTQEGGQWFYVNGIISPKEESSQKLSRNSPCPCGSGKKLKKCCG